MSKVFVPGRTGADARRVVGVEGLVYVGEHGLELEPQAEEWVDRPGEATESDR